MDFSKLFVGGAIIGTLISCWATLKGMAAKLSNVLVRRAELLPDCSEKFIAYLIRHYKYSNFYDKKYDFYNFHLKFKGQYGCVGAERFDRVSLVFWNGRWPFYLSYSQVKEGDKQNEKCTIYYLRGTLDLEKLLRETTTWYNNCSENWSRCAYDADRFRIKYLPESKGALGKDSLVYDLERCSQRYFTHHSDELGFRVDRNSLKNVILTDENRKVIELAQLWKNNKEWYIRKNIPWKTGWLLHGLPGTGKSLISRAVAETLDIPIFVFRLDRMDNENFIACWKDLQSYIPCVALMEDFDNIFDGRTNIVPRRNPFGSLLRAKQGDAQTSTPNNDQDVYSGELTFDTLINAIDGVERLDGIFTIITTNCIDKVDPALLNRPGRIDHVIELSYLTYENKFKMIDNMLADMPDVKQQMIEYVHQNANEKLTPAALTEKMTSAALRVLYDVKGS